jgi:hypothetical protein
MDDKRTLEDIRTFEDDMQAKGAGFLGISKPSKRTPRKGKVYNGIEGVEITGDAAIVAEAVKPLQTMLDNLLLAQEVLTAIVKTQGDRIEKLEREYKGHVHEEGEVWKHGSTPLHGCEQLGQLCNCETLEPVINHRDTATIVKEIKKELERYRVGNLSKEQLIEEIGIHCKDN